MSTGYIEWEGHEATPGASGIPVLNIAAGTYSPVEGYVFDAASDEYVYVKGVVRGYGSGGSLKVRWSGEDGVTSGDVVLEAAIAAITPETDATDVEEKAFATACKVTDAHLGTEGRRQHEATIDLSSHLDSLADGDSFRLKIGRPASSDEDDTYAGGVKLEHFELTFTEA